MKLVVFAHTPPPHLSQSYTVQLLLAGIANERHGIECFHVNAPFPGSAETTDAFLSRGAFQIFLCCLRAIWLRFRHGADNFYYVPAPGKRAALHRDWLVMLLCRPFFKRLILHWHAAGRAKWLEAATNARVRDFTYQRFKNASISIASSDSSRLEAEKFLPRQVTIVPDNDAGLEQIVQHLRHLEAGVQTATGWNLPPPHLKLALTILAENPARKTGLSSMFHELVSRSLKLFPDVSWLIFAGPNQDWKITDPRVEVIRVFSANDRLGRRLFADHFLVSDAARKRGAHALLTVGFVPLRKRLPTVLHILSLQTLDKRNRLGMFRQLYRNSIMKHNWPKADLVITNSEWTAKQALAAHPQFENRLVISHEGLQHEIFNPRPDTNETAKLREKFGLEPGYFLWISNFYPYKQAELLIAAYARLGPEKRLQHPLVMAGGNWLNGLENARAQAKMLGVAADVKFLGWIDDDMLAPLYRQAAAFCLASREETFGRSVIEAMACNTVCLLNDIPIMREITGGHAVIVNFKNTNAVAEALEKITADHALVARLRTAGREHVQRFTFEKLATERVTAIQKLLSTVPTRA